MSREAAHVAAAAPVAAAVVLLISLQEIWALGEALVAEV